MEALGAAFHSNCFNCTVFPVFEKCTKDNSYFLSWIYMSSAALSEVRTSRGLQIPRHPPSSIKKQVLDPFLLISSCYFQQSSRELFRVSKSRLRLYFSNTFPHPSRKFILDPANLRFPFLLHAFSLSESFKIYCENTLRTSTASWKFLTLFPQTRSSYFLESCRMQPWKPVVDTLEIWCLFLETRPELCCR